MAKLEHCSHVHVFQLSLALNGAENRGCEDTVSVNRIIYGMALPWLVRHPPGYTKLSD